MPALKDFPRIPVGISSCLLGEKVRFDGGHKKNDFINNHLVSYMDFQPVCPEVAIGLGVPRPPIRQTRTEHGIRVLGSADPGLDVTDRLHEFGDRMAGKLSYICGYIFKSDSPSCGMERVKTWPAGGGPGRRDGVGAYAGQIMFHQPNMPAEEEGRLNDDGLRDNFIERVFVYYRWKRLLEDGITPAKLVQFHTRHKLVFLAHNQAAYRRLGQLVASAGKHPAKDLLAEYETGMMSALKRKTSRKQHGNVLQHLAGYVSKHIDADDRKELAEIIDDYRNGLLPLTGPITLIKHHLRHHPNEWASDQYYLDPYPRELRRNH